jgi:Bacterial regulatory proteins, gntR family
VRAKIEDQGLTSDTRRALGLAAEAIERTPVNSTSLLPAYLQLAIGLGSLIIARGMSPGDPLPSEGELQERYGVSRDTARNAIRTLRGIGLVETRRGVGHFVGLAPEVREVTLAPGARVTVRLPGPGEETLSAVMVLDVTEPGKAPRTYGPGRTVLVVPE